MRRAFLPLALFGAASLAVLANGHAAPLEPEVCAKLKDERVVLEQAGVRGNMAKGPQWAKANLPPDKLEQVRRLIDVESQLLFRCSGQRLIELPAGVEADPAAAVPLKEAAEDKETPPAKADAAPGEKKAPADKKAAVAKTPSTDKAAPAKTRADEGAAKAKAPAQKGAPAKRAPEKASEAGAEPKAAAKAKPKSKAKVDDAFKPPPSDPENPFPNAKQ
jgi:hypothetical protein